MEYLCNCLIVLILVLLEVPIGAKETLINENYVNVVLILVLLEVPIGDSKAFTKGNQRGKS